MIQILTINNQNCYFNQSQFFNIITLNDVRSFRPNDNLEAECDLVH